MPNISKREHYTSQAAWRCLGLQVRQLGKQKDSKRRGLHAILKPCVKGAPPGAACSRPFWSSSETGSGGNRQTHTLREVRSNASRVCCANASSQPTASTEGAQPLRWLGQRTHGADGALQRPGQLRYALSLTSQRHISVSAEFTQEAEEGGSGTLCHRHPLSRPFVQHLEVSLEVMHCAMRPDTLRSHKAVLQTCQSLRLRPNRP